MNEVLLKEIEFVSKQTQQDVPSVLSKAVELGIHQLWIQTQLDLYLRGKISREEAIKAVGSKWVELAECQQEAVLEDIRWGMSR